MNKVQVLYAGIFPFVILDRFRIIIDSGDLCRMIGHIGRPIAKSAAGVKYFFTLDHRNAPFIGILATLIGYVICIVF